MSPPLPSEILDLIVDFLHNERDALKACCLVSKSWIHRTRRHLFVHVELTWKSRIKVWKEMFPDPFSSPARHTRCLSIRVSQVVIPVDTGLGGWIRTFSGVVRLHVDLCGLGGDRKISFVPLHGLSPTLKSLRLACGSSTPSSEIFGLVCSFPLLEDLALVSLGGNCEIDEWDIPSTSPKFTGSLDLRMVGGIGPVVHRLSELPSGLHFSKISVSCLKEDVESTVDLMSKCSDTLESLSIYYYIVAEHNMPLLDLSKFTKLKDVVFGCTGSDIQRVTITLQTAESINLERITIHSPRKPIAESAYQEWQDLDRLLLRFWTSRSTRPRIRYRQGREVCDLKDLVPKLLPELASRGVVELIEIDESGCYVVW